MSFQDTVIMSEKNQTREMTEKISVKKSQLLVYYRGTENVLPRSQVCFKFDTQPQKAIPT